MDFQTTVLEAIKEQFIATAGPREFGNGDSRQRRLYYLKKLEDNLVLPMNDVHASEYRDGSGNELDWKMSSIRSSSAMTFNLFGNGPVRLANSEFADVYDVQYEFRLPTLRGNPHPANLDAYLIGKNVDVYCEMKMTEWMGATLTTSPRRSDCSMLYGR